MANNGSGGPWGSGGGNRPPQGGGGKRPPQGGGRPPQGPDIDDLLNKGRDQLRAIMGGRGGGSGGASGSGGGGGIGRGGIILILIAALGLWAFQSFYRVDTSEQSVELLFGEYYKTGDEGLNFAPWPVVTKVILPVTRENTENIGVGRGTRADEGLMLTGDENIVDIDFQVVWNISDPQKFLFNLAASRETIQAVSESAMREIIARSNLAPILNRDRGAITAELRRLTQDTLDSYDSGVNIIRVNLLGANPPQEVINAFREVQAAEQTRDTLEKQADAYANRVVAEARGEAAQLLEQAEGYRAQVVNEAEGEAARFVSVYDEFAKAPEVTRKRLYIETIERVFGDVNKIIIDESAEGGQGVVPYLPLNELNRQQRPATTTGGN
ncbi:MAG: FtsH protease activity modulator HflK [Pseudomonadota bacterium]